MKEIKKFTYYDYIKYTRKLVFYSMLKEDSKEYKLNQSHQYKDKGYKLVFEDKEEAIQFINKTMKIENTLYAIKKEEIEKYNSSFITQDFKSKEADVVYKKKDEDVFFLIEHQSKVDYSMAYRILNYCIEIIRCAVDKDKLGKKKYQIPVVYPIVLYTGKAKWNAKKYLEECQVKLKGVGGENFASYNLIDVNEYTEEELWKEDNFLSKMLLLEKAKRNNQISEYIQKMEKENLNNKQINILVQMIYNSVDRKLKKEAIKNFLEIMKNRNGGGSMSALEEYLDSLIDIGIKQGKENGKMEILKQVVKNMLQFGEKDDKIMKYMGIEKEELESIKGMI